MEPKGHQRKLTVIFSADVQGYTRLMGENEDATYDALSERLGLIDTLITEYGGRVVNISGDGILVDFASVVDAVKCAVEFQRKMDAENADLPEHRRIEFRIGINLGDVIIQNGDIFGDSVNIAARLEGVAEAGGICISRSVYSEVKNKLALGFEYVGEQELKNVVEPVEIFKIRMEPDTATSTASRGRRAHELPLPSRPSLAVLPFVNMSGSPEQDFFSDGITEDLITNLSKFHELFVIARNSSFTYKEKPVKVQQVGRELGVRYVLEGSVRRAGNRVRITGQLVDAFDGHHLWAERYDRELKDIFAVQDDVTQSITVALAVTIKGAERERAMRVETETLAAYGFLLRGQSILLQFTREGNAQARCMFEKAVELDPEYARAYGALSRTHNYDWRYSWSESPAKSLDRALDLAKKAVALDDMDARGHAELGFVYLYKKQTKLAIAAYERALSLNPNDADVMAEMADALDFDGRPEEAVKLLRKAMRLNPYYPDWYLWTLGSAYFQLQRYEEAIATLHKMHNPGEGRRLLAASYAQLGRVEEARAQSAELLRVHPDFSVERWAERQPDQNSDALQRLIEGLQKAGLP